MVALDVLVFTHRSAAATVGTRPLATAPGHRHEPVSSRVKVPRLASRCKDSDRYKVATCTQVRPVFCGSARQAHGKVIAVSILRALAKIT